MFNSETTATGGIDKLMDDRSRLSLLTEADEQIGLIRLVQSQVDKTFQPPIKMTFQPPIKMVFRLINDRGYMWNSCRVENSKLCAPSS